MAPWWRPCCTNDRDLAREALDLIKAEFGTARPPDPDDRTIFDHLVKTAPSRGRWRRAATWPKGERLAAGSVVEQTYLNSYVAHSPMETHSATAQFEDGKVTVWASSQAPFQVKNAVAAGLGSAPTTCG